jgi:hypothetical protein
MHLRRFFPFAGRASGLAPKRSSRWTGSEFRPIAGEVRQGNGLQPSRGRVYATGNRDGQTEIPDYFLGDSVRAGLGATRARGIAAEETDLNSQAGRARCAPLLAGEGVGLHNVSARTF